MDPRYGSCILITQHDDKLCRAKEAVHGKDRDRTQAHLRDLIEIRDVVLLVELLCRLHLVVLELAPRKEIGVRHWPE